MKKKLLAFIALICFSVLIYAQGFTEINANFVGLGFGDVAWGDYDNDGDLDLIYNGEQVAGILKTMIYKNEGNDVFTEVSHIIPGGVSDIEWGDYDGDGDLDILTLGLYGSQLNAKIYENKGNDVFDDSGIILPNLNGGDAGFVDYNNDGYLDFFISGLGSAKLDFVMYKNIKNQSFEAVNIDLPKTSGGTYEWGDFDNDGDMDVFITGLYIVDNNPITDPKLYENNGNETFTLTSNNFIDECWVCDAEWGDYDSDGDLDILFTGGNYYNDDYAYIYRNEGNGTFVLQNQTGLTEVGNTSSTWGDYDNDGDLDILLFGSHVIGPSQFVTELDVFVNSGNNTFPAANLSLMDSLIAGEAAWGDYDNDGDLDFVCTGHNYISQEVYTILYRNDNITPNTIPSMQGTTTTLVVDNSVDLSWMPATDNETPSAGLTYNAYIRNDQGDFIWNSASDISNGYRLIPSLGNAQHNTNWSISDLENGDYFWSVQAIDNNFAGSSFLNEAPFTINTNATEEIVFNNNLLKNVYPNPFNQATTISYELKQNAYVQIAIYNMKGQQIRKLVDKNENIGQFSVIWNGDNELGNFLDAGFYYVQLKINEKIISTKKCIFIK